MMSVIVLCDAPAHRRRTRVGELPMHPSLIPSALLARLTPKPLQGLTPTREEHYKFRCTRCADGVDLRRAETISRVRAALAETGVSEVTLTEIRAILLVR